MPKQKVDFTEDARLELDRIPRADPAGVKVWSTLEGFARGELEPKVPQGKIGFHKVPLKGDRKILLGLDRRDPDRIRVVLVKLVSES